MEEIWKDIKGYEGRYQVSNFGKVRSLNWNKTGYVRELYLKKHNKGYLQVELSDGLVKKMFTVHRLVASAFIPNPNNLPIVNHKDENKRNNNVDNLEWCTKSYNIRAYLNNHPGIWKGRQRKKSGRYSKTNGLTIKQCDKDGNVIKHWRCVREIELENKWSAWSIAECCRGNRKTAYGYTWQYANENNSDKEAAI